MSLWRSVGWDYTIPLKKKQKVFCKQETKASCKRNSSPTVCSNLAC
uniref:Uncharacterized protein n=1 Tax=Anguilla anguilla TaxID=7936 RepID=A0A0E9PZ99_ANGAN